MIIDEKLTAEEQAAFETGDMSALPADYAAPAEETPPPEAAAQPKTDETAAPKTEAPAQEKIDADAAAAVEGQPRKTNESVPLAVFMDEKKARQAFERQVQELNEKFSRVDERLAMLQQDRQPAQAEKPAGPPNPEEDIFGASRWALDRISEFDQRFQQTQQQQQQEFQQRQLEQQVISTYAQVVQERVAADPTFTEAQNYLINSRYQELLADGHDPASAQQAVHAEEFQLAYDSLQRRINPADRITAIAKARGWAPKAPEPAPTNNDADKLAQIAKGQEAAASLSAAGTSGTAKTGKVDGKALADMTDKEFASWMAQNGSDGFREALGG